MLIRNYPAINAEIINQLNKDDIIKIIGNTGEKTIIDNSEGTWLLIVYDNGVDDEIGWLFSKYVTLNDIEYVPLKFVEIIPETDRISLVKLSYALSGEENINRQYSNMWKNYYVIIWGPFEYFFHYKCKPGIYLLDKDTHELKHVTYFGSYEAWPHAFTMFTDDLEYIIQDSGSSPGVRNITVWKIKNMKKVFSGSRYHDIDINGHTIKIVYPCNGHIDEEIMEYAKIYREKNQIPQEMEKQREGLEIDLIIICTYNLDTGERIIIDGKYIYTQ